MLGPVIVGQPVISQIIQIGQAPGVHEAKAGQPFAWTAGQTLFKWYQSIGISEPIFRSQVYMAAVCRCFPGKLPKGGDRVPSQLEILHCQDWLKAEIKMLKPKLIIPVGRLAMKQFLDFDRLTEVVGQCFEIDVNGVYVDCIALPHPSGASPWHRMQPGKGLLARALNLVRNHPQIAPLIRLSY